MKRRVSVRIALEREIHLSSKFNWFFYPCEAHLEITERPREREGVTVRPAVAEVVAIVESAGGEAASQVIGRRVGTTAHFIGDVVLVDDDGAVDAGTAVVRGDVAEGCLRCGCCGSLRVSVSHDLERKEVLSYNLAGSRRVSGSVVERRRPTASNTRNRIVKRARRQAVQHRGVGVLSCGRVLVLDGRAVGCGLASTHSFGKVLHMY